DDHRARRGLLRDCAQASVCFPSHCPWCSLVCLFFFHGTATPRIYPLSLHDALPISPRDLHPRVDRGGQAVSTPTGERPPRPARGDRKSTRLNSSHVEISYAVFCLKKKTAEALAQTEAAIPDDDPGRIQRPPEHERQR